MKTKSATNSSQAKETDKFDPQAWRKLLGPKHWLSWFALLLLAIIYWVPNRIRDAFAYLLSFPLSLFPLRPKMVVYANLRTVFPEKSDKELATFYRRFVCYGLISFLSYGEVSFLPRFMLKRRWKVKNIKVLEKAKQSGRPIAFAMPHMLFIDRCGLYLSFSGLPMFALVNRQKNPVFDWFINCQRIVFGGEVFLRDQGLRPLLRAFKKGFNGYLVIDEDLGSEFPYFAPSLGVPKASVPTLASLVKAANIYVLYICPSYNLKTANYELELLEAENIQSSDFEKDLVTNNMMLESIILKHPEQYMWFFRIFKTVPDLRYFVDIYTNVEIYKDLKRKGQKVDYFKDLDPNFDYEHRRVPFQEPIKPPYAGYVPLIDYEPIVRELYGLDGKEDDDATAANAAAKDKDSQKPEVKKDSSDS